MECLYQVKKDRDWWCNWELKVSILSILRFFFWILEMFRQCGIIFFSFYYFISEELVFIVWWNHRCPWWNILSFKKIIGCYKISMMYHLDFSYGRFSFYHIMIPILFVQITNTSETRHGCFPLFGTRLYQNFQNKKLRNVSKRLEKN